MPLSQVQIFGKGSMKKESTLKKKQNDQ